MRHFSYYLFEGFDAEKEAQNPGNPRVILTEHVDEMLNFVAENLPGKRSRGEFCKHFGEKTLASLQETGILRADGERLYFDAPVFLREDASALISAAAPAAERLCGVLSTNLSSIHALVQQINNSFPPERNLYHILCGMVFDGFFFDALERRNALATSRMHPSGLDYLAIVYETCGELNQLSDGLLCSFNRLQDERCALTSFGDADGARRDLYRFFRIMESGNLPGHLQKARDLYRSVGEPTPETVLSEAMNLALRGQCDPNVHSLLTYFGYSDGTRFCVPVFLPEHRKIISEIAHIVEEHLADFFADELTAISRSARITPDLHGVDFRETANELYHILFGMINEALIRQRTVSAPPRIPGEGRYLRCVEIINPQ